MGEDVTAADIISVADLTPTPELALMLDEFLDQIRQFRIDNVVAVRWRDGYPELVKVAEHTTRDPRPRLL